MCGRYTLYSTEMLTSRFSLDDSKPLNLVPNKNVSPGQTMPVIINPTGQGNQLALMRWGLVPSWAKDPSIGSKLFNARADTIMIKPSFKSAFAHRRCLIPASGFFEWQKVGTKKVPHYFTLKFTHLFAFAGIYEQDTYSIITTTPNDIVKPIHDRMPVILSPIDESIWLNNQSAQTNLISLLKPYPNQDMSISL